jgi:phosphatidylglycerol:prolipoprotein diacylglycerol transferase
MYPVVFLLSAATTASTTGLPFFHLGGLDLGPVPIQWFGMIVAAGVLIGASLLRRYAEWHGVSDDHIRGLTGWVTVSGFLGAHWFDSIFYEWDRLSADPLLFFKVWDGISSYGGFVGGAVGFALYVWWKRLPARLMADITIVGLLPAFSIGRIGCTVVSDHIGAAADVGKWYAGLAMDYPVERLANGAIDTKNTLAPIVALVRASPALKDATHVLAWNLGLIEFLYLVPVNLLLLFLAFRKKRPNAGSLVVMTGILYAPVRFFLDYLRPNQTDPRYFGLTFAQFCSLAAFSVAVFALTRIMKNGKPAEPIAPTSGEAQRRLKVVLKDADEPAKKPAEVATVKPTDDDKKKAAAKPAAKAAKADDAKKADDTKADETDVKADDAQSDVTASEPDAKASDAKADVADAAKPSPDDVATIKPGDKSKK